MERLKTDRKWYTKDTWKEAGMEILITDINRFLRHMILEVTGNVLYIIKSNGKQDNIAITNMHISVSKHV